MIRIVLGGDDPVPKLHLRDQVCSRSLSRPSAYRFVTIPMRPQPTI